MSGTSQPARYYVGWDVGGWNCDKNSKSRDAIVILDAQHHIVGKTPFWGNLRQDINDASTAAEWVEALFSRCNAAAPVAPYQVTLAIDTPLGFSRPFVELVTNLAPAGSIGKSEDNPYLFRQTELILFSHGFKPLSPVKDMIGSQATKGMHVLGKFARNRQSCGVWSDRNGLTVIETYPSVCKGSATIKWLQTHGNLGHQDLDDALTCALIAYLHSEKPALLEPPPKSVPPSEGWIWVPKDVLNKKKSGGGGP